MDIDRHKMSFPFYVEQTGLKSTWNIYIYVFERVKKALVNDYTKFKGERSV